MAAEQSTESKLSESEFLRTRAEHAKAEIANSLNRAKDALAHNVDPRELTRRHPWVAIASAGIAGFTAAVVAIPSKHEQELHRLQKLQQAMNPPPLTAAPTGDSNGHPKKAFDIRSLLTSILHEVIQLVRPILLTAIASGVKSGMNPPPPAAAAPPVPPGADDDAIGGAKK